MRSSSNDEGVLKILDPRSIYLAVMDSDSRTLCLCQWIGMTTLVGCSTTFCWRAATVGASVLRMIVMLTWSVASIYVLWLFVLADRPCLKIVLTLSFRVLKTKQRLPLQAPVDRRFGCWKVLSASSICRWYVHWKLHFDDWCWFRKSCFRAFPFSNFAVT